MGKSNLRAIRLEKNAGRITDEGKDFTGESVLAKQYTALRNYVSREYLEPQKKLQEKIEQIKEWNNQAEFIANDLQKLRQRYVKNNQQLKQKKAKLIELQKDFERKNAIFTRQQQDQIDLNHLINFLEDGTGSVNQLTLALPKSVFPLVK